ncbi:MAG: endonuclease/exonuclease/phosphatase family protein [Fimbriimonadales bacterium]|nr:endonuclease/exonuclease/phosphatase family protein [Fimbriimonadales bacterium]
MKGTRFLKVALLWGLALAIAGASEVRILSWNIARAVGANNPNEERAPYVAKIMNHLRPDILILQEVGGETRTSWNATTQESVLDSFVRNNLTFFGTNPVRNRDYYLYVNRLSDGWISNAIISRYPFRNITDVNIGSPNRGLTVGFIDVPGTNGLGVFGAHFKAGGYTSDAVARQTNAENTRDTIRQWRGRNRRAAYVLGGDLNENEDPDLSSTFDIGGELPDGRYYAPISTVMSARLRDPVPVDALGGKRTYQITSRNSDLRRRLDYLMVSTTELGRDRINVLEAVVFNTRRFPAGALPNGFDITDSQNASDHAALFLRIRIDVWRSYGDGSGYWVPEPSAFLVLLVFSAGSVASLKRRKAS